MKGCGSGFFVRERENAQRESRSERGLGERREKKKSENEDTHYCTYNIILSSKPATVPL